MSVDEWDSELEVEEWKIHSLSSIKAKYDTLSLGNEAGKAIDSASLRDNLASIKGIKSIKTLIIEPSSMLKDLDVLQAMPDLQTLQIHGKQLRTLDGLEWFRNGWFIQIETDKNRIRNIDKISETKITKLLLQYGNPGDIEAIGRSRTINELVMSNPPKLALDSWRGVPLDTLTLSGGEIEVLADTADIKSLKRLLLLKCRKLERFEGNNSGVTWMIIDTCNQLDLSTLKTFSKLEHASIVNLKTEFPLSIFAELKKLRSISLEECKVLIDKLNLKFLCPKLEDIFIGRLKKDQGIALSKANPGVVVTNGTWSYENGSLVENRF